MDQDWPEGRRARSGAPVSTGTIIVVQSGDLAAWVGAVSGLAGVVLGAGIDGWRRRRAEAARRRSDLIRAGARLFLAASAYRSATSAAGAARKEPQWQAVINPYLAEMTEAGVTINEPGIREISKAGMAVAGYILRKKEPATPREASDEVHAQTDLISAYNEAVRKAKL